MMDSRAFHNALRILHNLSSYELQKAGVIDENWGTPEASVRDQIGSFIDNPFREALRMPDANFDRLFGLIESRQRVKDPKPCAEAEIADPGKAGLAMARHVHGKDIELRQAAKTVAAGA